jgi:hypothetical protein
VVEEAVEVEELHVSAELDFADEVVRRVTMGAGVEPRRSSARAASMADKGAPHGGGARWARAGGGGGGHTSRRRAPARRIGGRRIRVACGGDLTKAL